MGKQVPSPHLRQYELPHPVEGVPIRRGHRHQHAPAIAPLAAPADAAVSVMSSAATTAPGLVHGSHRRSAQLARSSQPPLAHKLREIKISPGNRTRLCCCCRCRCPSTTKMGKDGKRRDNGITGLPHPADASTPQAGARAQPEQGGDEFSQQN